MDQICCPASPGTAVEGAVPPKNLRAHGPNICIDKYSNTKMYIKKRNEIKKAATITHEIKTNKNTKTKTNAETKNNIKRNKEIKRHSHCFIIHVLF
jgi:hypothetical protein